MAVNEQLVAYRVWDAPTRWFHWINVLCILILAGIGVVILNANALGVNSDGKVTLKIIHAWTGYVFALNLLWRFIWGFVGNKPVINAWETISQVPARTEISDKISKDLKKRGMSFVGSTIIYAYMQAVGLVNDHTKDCWKYCFVENQI